MNHTQQRKKPILDSYVIASVNLANGHYDHMGRYETVTLKTGTDDYDEAKEIRNALYRSARHMNIGLDCEMTQESNGNYAITFTAVHPSYHDNYWHPLAIWKRQKGIR